MSRLAFLAGFACAVGWLASARAQVPPPALAPACRDGWTPPLTAKTIAVANVRQLEAAVRDAGSDTTILLADGVYWLDSMLDVARPRIVLRSRSGDAERTIVRGEGMTERRVGVAVSISASDVTVADLTIGMVGYHAVQIRGERGASRVMLHNLRVANSGQQLIKGSSAGDGSVAQDDTVACSTIGYSDTAPSDYTDGIDVIAGRGWIVRDNVFLQVRGPASRGYAAGPAILFWGGSAGTLVERNVVVDSFRGIALGLTPSAAPGPGNAARPDHAGGTIRNNIVWNRHPWGDEGIETNGAADVRIDHNTVFVEGSLGWSISLRFPLTTALVRNNLTNRAIARRDGGRAQLDGNVTGADAGWFVDAAHGDLRPLRQSPAIGRGVALPEVARDFDGCTRPASRPDAGALQFEGAR